MTREELFNELIKSNLFNSINQTHDIQEFLLARTAAYLVSEESEEFRGLLEKKRQYEEKFKKDEEGSFLEYFTLSEEIALTSEFLYFQQGFFEGVKFILALGSFCIVPESFLYFLDTQKAK